MRNTVGQDLAHCQAERLHQGLNTEWFDVDPCWSTATTRIVGTPKNRFSFIDLDCPVYCVVSLFTVSFPYCNQVMAKPMSTDRDGLIEEVLTKEQQDELTPASVIKTLRDGNSRFVAGQVTVRNHKAQIRKAAASQYPKAIVLSCVDSRVPVEDVFDRGIGDLFVARVAGNFVNPDILGSMEFACHVSGAKVILVLGHEHCGAVKSAIDDVKLGNITEMLAKVMPAVEQTPGFENDRTSKNVAFVHAVAERNVKLTIDRIRAESEILRQMEEDHSIAIVGALYDMDNGTVSFLE